MDGVLRWSCEIGFPELYPKYIGFLAFAGPGLKCLDGKRKDWLRISKPASLDRHRPIRRSREPSQTRSFRGERCRLAALALVPQRGGAVPESISSGPAHPHARRD